MSYQNPNPQPLDLKVYDTGYEDRLKGLKRWKLIFGLNWMNPSWRAGWTDAGRALISNPELAISPRRRSPRRKKGTK